MKNAIFFNLPLTETGIPPASVAALAPVFKSNSINLVLKDVNIDIVNSIDSVFYDTFWDWCQRTTTLTADHKLKLIHWIDVYLDSVEPSTDLFAVSVFSIYSVSFATIFLERLKIKFPNTPLLVGGNGVSSNLGTETDNKSYGEFLLAHQLVDNVIFGEGEVALDHFLKNLTYPGINKNNPVQIENLDQLPASDFSMVNFDQYHSRRLLITGSRGCVRKCTFCDIENTWPKFQHRSPENILNEIIKNKLEYGISQFEFTDSLINGSISSWIKFNELLANAKQKDRDLQDITYSGQFICRQESSHPKLMYELMHHAGATQLTVGIESFSEKIRNLMKKKFSNDAIDYHLEQCGYWGIPNIFLMIVGYPGETIDDHRQNIDALYKYQTFSDMGTIFMMRWGFTMHIYQDTQLYKQKNELGLILNDNVEIDGFYTWVSSFDLSLDIVERIRRRVELHELSYNLGYSQPNTYSELNSLKSLLKSYNSTTTKKLIQMHTK
jgi:hypothetical protein